MTDGNGWSKHELDVMNRLDDLKRGQDGLENGQRELIKSFTQHVIECNNNVNAHITECNAVFGKHAEQISNSKWFGVLSGGGIVVVFLLVLLIARIFNIS